MVYFIQVLHGLGAIIAGFYLLLPFFTKNLSKLNGDSLLGYTKVLFAFNRIGQYVLIAQFITGGYLISKADYSLVWIILVIVLFIIAGALPGMMSRPMKRILKQEGNVGQQISKVVSFSTITAIVLVVLIYFMYYPIYQ